MAAALNKRHQARNERALQDLIKTVPGNERCADCGARNPGMSFSSGRDSVLTEGYRMGQLEREFNKDRDQTTRQES